MRRRTRTVIIALPAICAYFFFWGVALPAAIIIGGVGIETPYSLKASADCANWPLRSAKSRETLANATDDKKRFHVLGEAAKSAFEVGDREEAAIYARDLLDLAPRYVKSWDYGNAIHDAHLVLGRVALAQGEIEEAKRQLLQAGATPGSPQLNSFGPNLSLARELLKKGERRAVYEYFTECGRFWTLGKIKLAVWRVESSIGLPPDFGANLIF